MQCDMLLLPSPQTGSELSSRLEALNAEKDSLRKAVSEQEQELLSTKGLIEEKELLWHQEAEKSAKEIGELRGKLVDKVPGREPWCCLGGILFLP